MVSPRWLSLFLAWTLLLQSLAPALASPRPIHAPAPTQSAPPIHHASHENHEYLVDTSQAYAEVIQEAEWVNNALPLLTRYDIGLDRLRMFKSQVTSNGPPPVYSPVLSGWYLFDGLGSTRAVVDDSGVGQSEFGYADAFGIPYKVESNGSRADAGLGFFLNGQQWDGSGVWNSGEGLYFNRARFYQPGLGRFVGEDPVLGDEYQPRTLHKYTYAGGNPVNYIDRSGREFTLAGISISTAIQNSARLQQFGQAINVISNIYDKVSLIQDAYDILSQVVKGDDVDDEELISFGFGLFSSIASLPSGPVSGLIGTSSGKIRTAIGKGGKVVSEGARKAKLAKIRKTFRNNFPDGFKPMAKLPDGTEIQAIISEERLEHFLTRHHPDFIDFSKWSADEVANMWPKTVTPNGVLKLLKEALQGANGFSEHRDSLGKVVRDTSDYIRYRTRVQGTTVVIGIDKITGEVRQFFPIVDLQ